jgi:uncharacterized membrane protein
MYGIGTMSFEDIYGAGSLDTLPAGTVGETQKKTNPNDSEQTGAVAKDKTGILNIKGNLLGQPITAWVGLLILLIGLKYLVEMKE